MLHATHGNAATTSKFESIQLVCHCLIKAVDGISYAMFRNFSVESVTHDKMRDIFNIKSGDVLIDTKNGTRWLYLAVTANQENFGGLNVFIFTYYYAAMMSLSNPQKKVLTWTLLKLLFQNSYQRLMFLN